MKEFVINKKYIDKDICYIIRKEFPHLNNASLNKAFRLRDIKVNDTRVSKAFIPNPGDTIKIYLSDDILFGFSYDIYYAYEDDNILVAYKPKGIESNNEQGLKDASKLFFEDIVKEQKGNNLSICHRLDMNTEGLVIFAKNDTSYNEIIKLFKSHNIEKEYIALVYGNPEKSHDTLENYIIKDTKCGYSKILDCNIHGAKSCITEYTVLEHIKTKNCCLLNIKLHTGRTHQIRAHMKYINTPIIGDPKYSTNEINNKFKLYSQVLYAAKYNFHFDNSSSMSYLNKIDIDISDYVIKKIYKLIDI